MAVGHLELGHHISPKQSHDVWSLGTTVEQDSYPVLGMPAVAGSHEFAFWFVAVLAFFDSSLPTPPPEKLKEIRPRVRLGDDHATCIRSG